MQFRPDIVQDVITGASLKPHEYPMHYRGDVRVRSVIAVASLKGNSCPRGRTAAVQCPQRDAVASLKLGMGR